jgi:hypothetical protein
MIFILKAKEFDDDNLIFSNLKFHHPLHFDAILPDGKKHCENFKFSHNLKKLA